MSNIIGFSKGLYSSWFYYAPSRSLFDCGEGCASFLGNKVNAVQNIFISHDHNDHIAGLLTFIAARESGMMAMIKDEQGEEVGKPLNIFYPNTPASIIPCLRDYITKTFPKPSFELNWYAINPGDIVQDTIVAFRTQHYNKVSLGYKIIEQRKKLRKKFEGQNIPELLRNKAVDRNDLMEEYTANVFAYTLDSNRYFDELHVAEANIWIADTTFLDINDRTGGNTHGSIDEMLSIAWEYGVKNVVCAHFSPRYDVKDIHKKIQACNKRFNPEMKIHAVDYTRVFNF